MGADEHLEHVVAGLALPVNPARWQLIEEAVSLCEPHLDGPRYERMLGHASERVRVAAHTVARLRALRAGEGPLARLPELLARALADPSDLVRAEGAGSMQWLRFAPSERIADLRRLLREARSAGSGREHAGLLVRAAEDALSELAREPDLGRICFPDGPYPAGHRIDRFSWRARLEPASGIWFDLELRSAHYEEDMPDRFERLPDEQLSLGGEVELSNWRSRASWRNHHRASLSSGAGEAVAPGTGFLASTRSAPLDLGAPSLHRVDPVAGGALPDDHDPSSAAFALYLLGPDCAVDHEIRIAPAGTGSHAIAWRGRIALGAGGSTALRFRFEAAITAVATPAIGVLPETSDEEAWDALRACVRDAAGYRLEGEGPRRSFRKTGA